LGIDSVNVGQATSSSEGRQPPLCRPCREIGRQGIALGDVISKGRIVNVDVRMHVRTPPPSWRGTYRCASTLSPNHHHHRDHEYYRTYLQHQLLPAGPHLPHTLHRVNERTWTRCAPPIPDIRARGRSAAMYKRTGTYLDGFPSGIR